MSKMPAVLDRHPPLERAVSRLNETILSKLDELIGRQCLIFVGDANGADKAVQQHFARRGYEHVLVYCMDECRNNVGNWPTKNITSPSSRRDFAYYVAKDHAMARDAKCGIMLWDGSCPRFRPGGAWRCHAGASQRMRSCVSSSESRCAAGIPVSAESRSRFEAGERKIAPLSCLSVSTGVVSRRTTLFRQRSRRRMCVKVQPRKAAPTA